MKRKPRRFAYLHGFASGPLSTKGQALKAAFQDRGLAFACPDLNQPSFSELRHGAALSAVERMVDDALDTEWALVGSSFGGWLAARFAELQPSRVSRLVLLCPGFDLCSRWPVLFGEAALERWRREGELVVPDSAGRPTGLHYAFFEGLRAAPAWPTVSCPTLILHGERDEVVPIEFSRRYARDHSNVELEVLDDDHGLVSSLPRIIERSLDFLQSP